MQRPWRWVVLMLALGAGVEARADQLIVLNKSGHEAAIVDPAKLAVVKKIPTGKGPHEVAVSPDGRRAYVADYGSYSIFREGQKPEMEPGRTITVLDLDRMAVADTFDLGEYRSPHGIAVSRDGTRLWVTCERNQAVLELDTRSGAILHAWKTGQDVSHMLVPTPDESKLYVASIRSGTVTVVTRGGGVKVLATGDGAEGIDVTPDGREVWVTNRGANTVSVIAVATDSVVATLEAGGNFPIRVKFTPDGKEAWVSNAQSNSLSVFSVATRKKVAGVEVGKVPVGIQMEPGGRRAFVANTNADQVTVLDLASRKVTGSFTTGSEPDGMAWVTRAGKR